MCIPKNKNTKIQTTQNIREARYSSIYLKLYIYTHIQERNIQNIHKSNKIYKIYTKYKTYQEYKIQNPKI